MQPPGAPHAQLVTRRYFQDAQYTADAGQMAAAGWRVVSIQREPTGALVATYAYAATSTATLGALVGPRSFLQRHAVAVSVSGGLLSALLLALVLALLGSVAPTSATTLDATPTATLTVATNPNAAATILASDGRSPAGAAMITDAQLGGPLSAFDSAYGPEASQDMWNTTLNGQPVLLVVGETRLGDSADGTARAVVIDIDGADTTHPWTAAQETTLVASFLPPDAKHTKDVAGYGQLGTDHIFISQDLAASLTPSVFENAENQQVTPGAFDWQCSTQQQVCEIGAG